MKMTSEKGEREKCRMEGRMGNAGNEEEMQTSRK